jgi:hypothetical protein
MSCCRRSSFKGSINKIPVVTVYLDDDNGTSETSRGRACWIYHSTYTIVPYRTVRNRYCIPTGTVVPVLFVRFSTLDEGRSGVGVWHKKMRMMGHRGTRMDEDSRATRDSVENALSSTTGILFQISYPRKGVNLLVQEQVQ